MVNLLVSAPRAVQKNLCRRSSGNPEKVSRLSPRLANARKYKKAFSAVAMGLPRVVSCSSVAPADVWSDLRKERSAGKGEKERSTMARRAEKKVAFTVDVIFNSAVRNGDVSDLVSIVKTFLAPNGQYSNVDESSVCLSGPWSSSVRSRRGGYSALHLCSLAGRADCVRALIACGADVFATDNAGWTPLHVAAWSGKSENVIRVLVKRGGLRLLNSGDPGRHAEDMASTAAIKSLLAGLRTDLETEEKRRSLAMTEKSVGLRESTSRLSSRASSPVFDEELDYYQLCAPLGRDSWPLVRVTLGIPTGSRAAILASDPGPFW